MDKEITMAASRGKNPVTGGQGEEDFFFSAVALIRATVASHLDYSSDAITGFLASTITHHCSFTI